MQYHRIAMLFVLALASSACATSDPGWTGTGAEPFDAAQAECERLAQTSSADDRDDSIKACMAERGWTRDSTATTEPS